MFDANRLTLRPRPGWVDYDVLDAGTGDPLARATQAVPRWVRIAGAVLKSRSAFPALIEVHAVDSELLLFSLRRGYLRPGRAVEIRDAAGVPVGFLTIKMHWFGPYSLLVLDRHREPFARVQANVLGTDYSLLTPDGGFELGKITRPKLTGVYTVEVGAESADSAPVKTLLVATALAVQMLFKS